MWSGDATTTPDELIAALPGSGVDVLCITDHNNVDGPNIHDDDDDHSRNKHGYIYQHHYHDVYVDHPRNDYVHDDDSRDDHHWADDQFHIDGSCGSPIHHDHVH